VIRSVMIPYVGAGTIGVIMLGLGRALGETIAVAYVIGGSVTLPHSIFEQGNSLAAVIALNFGEAESTPLYKSSLIAAGLVLFVLTLLVNLVARRYVVRASRPGSGGGGAAGRWLRRDRGEPAVAEAAAGAVSGA
jgi:ABC-type phosphate transport system permease subunit